MLRQTFKYYGNEKRFKDEIKSNFHEFNRLLLKQIKQPFLGELSVRL